MNQKILFALWGGMFSICAALGFIPEPEGAARILLTGISLACFVPPVLLLYGAKDASTVHLVGGLSAASLVLTLVCLLVNFAAAFQSEALGRLVHYVLVIVSSPMICSGHWAMSLFLWACLLMVSLKKRKQF